MIDIDLRPNLQLPSSAMVTPHMIEIFSNWTNGTASEVNKAQHSLIMVCLQFSFSLSYGMVNITNPGHDMLCHHVTAPFSWFIDWSGILKTFFFCLCRLFCFYYIIFKLWLYPLNLMNSFLIRWLVWHGGYMNTIARYEISMVWHIFK